MNSLMKHHKIKEMKLFWQSSSGIDSKMTPRLLTPLNLNEINPIVF